MRRTSLALIFVVALLAVPLTAEPLRDSRDRRTRDRGDHGVSRIVRVIKSIFVVRTESDGLMPPVPAAPPKP
jgi:hypothetical protein